MDQQALSPPRTKALIVGGVVAVAVTALYFGLGMPGMDHGDEKLSMDHGTSTTRQTQVSKGRSEVALLGPASFAARIRSNAVLLNVHVPFAGDIEGTKLSIPFDQIADEVKLLPPALDTPLLVYCRSGRMSAIAAAELIRLGYRDVSDLDGGMLAWEKSGRSLAGPTRSPAAP